MDTHRPEVILIEPAGDQSPVARTVRDILTRAGFDVAASADGRHVAERLAGGRGDGQQPAAVLIGPGVTKPTSVARQVHGAAPAQFIVFLPAAERMARLRQELAFAPMIGTHWSVASADDLTTLARVITDAAAWARQRSQFRTTLDRMNLRLSSSPPVDSGEYRKLVASDRYLANLLRHVPDAIFSLDPAGRVVSWNPAAEHLLEVTGIDAVGKPLTEVVEWPQELQALVRRSVNGESISGHEVSLAIGTRTVTAELTLTPVREEDGRLIGVVAILRDVTERRRAEQALREGEELVSTMAENSTQGMAMMDERGYCTYANRACLEMTGYSAEEIRSKPLHDLIHHHYPDGRPYPKEQCPIDRALPENFDVRAHEDLFFRKDGSTFPVLIAASPVFRDGRPVSTVVEIRDMTEAKRAEAERERLLESERTARVEAERASRMKDEFLANLSHELRTPLNAILGWSQILQTGRLDGEDSRQGLEAIERNARAQTSIIEDLLDLSRIISGKVRLDVQRLDLSGVVAAAIETVRPAAEAKGVRVHSALDPKCGPVSGDPNRLQQVFWNLLSNAVKFTPRGGRVQVVLERVNSQLEVSVTDTGEGIAPEFLPHVFDRFRQADGSSTRRHGGLGIGLSIVRQLAELHGGTVRAKSGGLGAGATFIVALPLTAVHPPAEEQRQHPAITAELRVAVPESVTLKGVRVLVVDDDADARDLLHRLLTDREADVVTAGSAGEAMEVMSLGPPTVLLADIGMPHEDGYALMRRVRALPAANGGGTPAIALTAYARSEDRTQAMLAGFQVHLSKPVEPGELIATVASLAGRTATYSTPGVPTGP